MPPRQNIITYRDRALDIGRAVASIAWVLAVLCAVALPARAADGGWQEAFNSRSRMTTGSVEQDGQRNVYAFFEIDMPQGWKTYWRNPGDAGGLPPHFDWSKSENLKTAKVLYPAPQRLTDEAGDTIGYKEHVVFPVRIAVTDASQPLRLTLEVNYGICKDICVPAQARHEVILQPAALGPAEAEALAALRQVPRSPEARKLEDPELKSVELVEAADKSKLAIEVAYPNGGEDADVFIEAPDGLYIPMVQKVGELSGGVQKFEAELGPQVSPKELKGKALLVTMVGRGGSSQASFNVP